MYYYIKGTLALLAGDTAVIDAGGIGYRLTVTQNTFAALASKLGKEAQLFTYLAVRDDAMELYGFASEEEKLFFTKLLSVSGIGPKAAVSVLSAFTPNQLVSAVQAGDAKMISRANGIGLKTAQKVIIELKGKARFVGRYGGRRSAVGGNGGGERADRTGLYKRRSGGGGQRHRRYSGA